ncbi:MAG: DUF3164 family protein [Gammaproteobacteria bacterium]|nr:DUF3164 family protein [Gammaproteobacteria bacterium]
MITQPPEGYMKDASGRLVPINLVTDIDKTRDHLVQEIIAKAQETNRLLSVFKNRTMEDIAAFIELSAEKYNISMGGQKGNITLMSFDGRFKVQRAVSEKLMFDERLQVAKELVDKCIHRWTEGSNPEIRALIEHAFQTDKQGNISTARIFSLMKLDIKDDDWVSAMNAIKDSIQVSGSKSYLRIYERINNSENYQSIVLDIASI